MQRFSKGAKKVENFSCTASIIGLIVLRRSFPSVMKLKCSTRISRQKQLAEKIDRKNEVSVIVSLNQFSLRVFFQTRPIKNSQPLESSKALHHGRRHDFLGRLRS